MTYENGYAPEAALVMVDGVHMAPSAATRFTAFATFAAEQGRTIRPAHPWGGYATIPEQWSRWNLYPGHTMPSGQKVAAPGHSTHGNYDIGRVDIVGSDGLSYTDQLMDWVEEHAPAFGLKQELGQKDRNHFAAALPFTIPTTTTAPPQLIVPRRPTMLTICTVALPADTRVVINTVDSTWHRIRPGQEALYTDPKWADQVKVLKDRQGSQILDGFREV